MSERKSKKETTNIEAKAFSETVAKMIEEHLGGLSGMLIYSMHKIGDISGLIERIILDNPTEKSPKEYSEELVKISITNRGNPKNGEKYSAKEAELHLEILREYYRLTLKKI